jgi:hypothetical protein
MQQVLAAPKLKSTTINHRYVTARPQEREKRVIGAAEKSRSLSGLLSSIWVKLTKPEPRYVPACANPNAPYEAAMNRVSRIDPYLYMKSLAG